MALYQTYRRINLYEGRAGHIYYGSLVFIMLVLTVYLFFSKGHLHQDRALHGSVFGRLRRPENITKLECSEFVRSSGAVCGKLNWHDMLRGDEKEIFVTTYIQERLVQEVAECGDTCTDPWEKVASKELYVASPEDFVLVLEHRVHSNVLTPVLMIDNMDTRGVLLKGGVPTSESSSHRNESILLMFPDDERDQIPLVSALEASNISLDDCDLKYGNTLDWSYRRWGVHIDFNIHYTNLVLDVFNLTTYLSPSTPEYQYSLKFIPMDTGVRKIETVNVEDSILFHNYEKENPGLPRRRRVIRRLYGIRLVFNQSGVIGFYSISSILQFIVWVVTLLSIPWTLAELYLTFLPSFVAAPTWYAAFVAEAQEKKQK